MSVLAVSSPWWEDYDIRDRFLCGDQGSVVVERNDAQASLISGRSRFTLFRVASSQPGLRFATDGMQRPIVGHLDQEIDVAVRARTAFRLRAEQVQGEQPTAGSKSGLEKADDFSVFHSRSV